VGKENRPTASLPPPFTPSRLPTNSFLAQCSFMVIMDEPSNHDLINSAEYGPSGLYNEKSHSSCHSIPFPRASSAREGRGDGDHGCCRTTLNGMQRPGDLKQRGLPAEKSMLSQNFLQLKDGHPLLEEVGALSLRLRSQIQRLVSTLGASSELPSISNPQRKREPSTDDDRSLIIPTRHSQVSEQRAEEWQCPFCIHRNAPLFPYCQVCHLCKPVLLMTRVCSTHNGSMQLGENPAQQLKSQHRLHHWEKDQVLPCIGRYIQEMEVDLGRLKCYANAIDSLSQRLDERVLDPSGLQSSVSTATATCPPAVVEAHHDRKMEQEEMTFGKTESSPIVTKSVGEDQEKKLFNETQSGQEGNVKEVEEKDEDRWKKGENAVGNNYELRTKYREKKARKKTKETDIEKAERKKTSKKKTKRNSQKEKAESDQEPISLPDYSEREDGTEDEHVVSTSAEGTEDEMEINTPHSGFRITDIELPDFSAEQPAVSSLLQEAPKGKKLRKRIKDRIQNRSDTLVFVGNDTTFAKNVDKVPFPELPSDFQVNDRQRREEKEQQLPKPIFIVTKLPSTYQESWYSGQMPLVVKVQAAVRGRLARRNYAKHKERTKIAREIFTTEKSYLEALSHLQECRNKLEESKGIKIKPASIKAIWQEQLVDMIDLARILSARLQSKVAPGCWHAFRELSDVFLDLRPRFSVYVPYIIHYTEALEVLHKVTKSNKRFKRFSDECAQAFRGLDFAAILIMPIQRVPRYILLLKALIKITQRSHPDYNQLNQALDLMSTIATDINNQVKKYENHLTVCKIDALLAPRIKDFVQPNREFVGSGMVIIYDDKKKLRRNKQKVRTVFLFSDVFLLAKHIPSSGTYHLKFMIYLNPSVHIEHNPYVKDVGNEHVDCVFRLHSERSDQSITLMTRSMEDKISWLIALEQTLFLIKDKVGEENNITAIQNS